MMYNVNNSATQVLCAKQIKENLFVSLLHRDSEILFKKVGRIKSNKLLRFSTASGKRTYCAEYHYDRKRNCNYSFHFSLQNV